MRLLAGLFRSPVPALPPMRQTSEILSDLDRQVGRLSSVRDRAVELIKKLETESDDSPQ